MTRAEQIVHARPWTRRIGAAAVALATATALLTGCSNSSAEPVTAPTLPAGKLPAEMVGQMKDVTTQAMQAVGASGAIVGVWTPWGGSWVSGLGTVATGSEKPVTTEMSFRAAVVTREMTCDVLYGMVADHIVKLDDPVSDWVVGFHEKDEMTLEQLCDGTSGLQSVPASVQAEFIANPDRVWNPRELASFGVGRGVSGKPGEAYGGADTGYLLLGEALERAADKSASELIAQYVTGPLGLRGTALPDPAPAAPAPSPALSGQVPQPGEDGALKCTEPTDITNLSSSFGYTNSGVTTTITDLGTYATALAQGALGNNAKERFANPLPAYKDAPTWYNADGGSIVAGSLVGEFGEVPGYSVAAFSDPATGLTVAVVLNSSVGSGMARNVAFQLAAMASKAPAAGGKTAPEAGLPFTAEQYNQQVVSGAKCPIG